jgi:hypothetical protein
MLPPWKPLQCRSTHARQSLARLAASCVARTFVLGAAEQRLVQRDGVRQALKARSHTQQRSMRSTTVPARAGTSSCDSVFLAGSCVCGWGEKGANQRSTRVVSGRARATHRLGSRRRRRGRRRRRRRRGRGVVGLLARCEDGPAGRRRAALEVVDLPPKQPCERVGLLRRPAARWAIAAAGPPRARSASHRSVFSSREW